MTELVHEDGRITGAVIRRHGKTMRIGARKGVVLAAGGFEQSATLRAQYVPLQPNPVRSGGQTGNTGDSIVAALAVGAATRNMHSTWSAPVFSVPGEERGRLSTIERALPGCIIVNQAGKRYLNEAASYHIVGQQMVALDTPEAGTTPSWVIFDHRFRHKYPMGPLLPLLPDWAQAAGVRAILKKAPTIAGLAAQIGVDAGDAGGDARALQRAMRRRGKTPISTAVPPSMTACTAMPATRPTRACAPITRSALLRLSHLCRRHRHQWRAGHR